MKKDTKIILTLFTVVIILISLKVGFEKFGHKALGIFFILGAIILSIASAVISLREGRTSTHIPKTRSAASSPFYFLTTKQSSPVYFWTFVIALLISSIILSIAYYLFLL